MSVTPTPTTELEAVNAMLESIGEAPVNSLGDEATHVDVARARRLLTQVSKQVQGEGWEFNSDEDYDLTPDATTSKIAVPSNALFIDADKETQVQVVQRGGFLYDKKNQVFTFNATITADIIWMFPFDELPEVARQYIFIRACRMFQDKSIGSDTLNSFNERDEAMARVSLERYEARTGDYNILNGFDQAYITRRWQARRIY